MGSKALRLLLPILAGLGVLLAALHLPVVRRAGLGMALRRVEAASGLLARAERLDYNLLGLDFRVRGLVLAAPGRDPLIQIKEARVHLGASTIWGQIDVRRVEAEGVSMRLVRDASGAWNLPPSSAPAGASGPLSIRLGSAVVRDASVHVEDEVADARLRAENLSLDLEGAGATTKGTAVAAAPVEWTMGGRQGRLEVAPMKVAFDGRDLAVESLRVTGPEGMLEVGGRLRSVTGAGVFDLDVKAETDLARLPRGGSEPRRGALTASGRVEGPFAAPVVQVSLSGRGVTWGAVEGATVDARLRADAKAVAVESAKAHVAGGSVTLHGRLALDSKDKSRLEARWEGLGGEALRAQGIEGTLSGHAEATGRGPRLVGLVLAAEIITRPGEASASGHWLLSGRSELAVRDGAWRLTADQAAGGELHLTGQLGGRFVESEPMASTLAGDVQVDVSDLSRFAPARAEVSGRGQVTATLGGTVGDPRASGSLEAFGVQALSLAEARADLTARFEADVSRVRVSALSVRSGETTLVGDGMLGVRDRVLEGRFTLSAPDVAALLLRVPPGVDPAGAFRAEGTLRGTLDRPSVQAVFSGTAVRVGGQSFDALAGNAVVEGATVRLPSLELTQAKGRLTVSGEYTPGGAVSLQAAGRGLSVSPVPGPLVGRPDPLPFQGVADLELTVSGRAEAPDGNGWIAMERATWEGREIGPLRADLRFEGGRVVADARAESLRAALAGRVGIAAPHAFELEMALERADLVDLAARAGLDAPPVTGTATGRARIRGDLGGRGLEAVEMEPDFVVESGKSRLAVTGGLGSNARMPLTATLEADLADATPWLPGPATGRLRATLTAEGTPSRPTVNGDLVVEEGTVQLSERRRNTVRGIAGRASLRDGALTLEGFEATWGGGHFRASGSATGRFLEAWLPPALRQAPGAGPPPRAALHASFDGDARRWMNLFVGEDTFESRGRDASVVAELTADAPRLDAVRGEVRWTGVDPVLSDVALTQEGTGRLLIADGKARLTETTWTGPDTRVHLQGTVDLASEGGPGQARVEGEVEGTADLRVLQFLGRGVETGGIGDFNLRVQGTLAAPVTEGEITFRDGFLRYRPTRVSLDSLHGTLRFSPEAVKAEGVQGSLNGGAMTLEGEVQRGERAGGEVRLRVRGAAVEWPQGFRANLYANVKLAPAGEGFLLSGNVNLGSGVYRTTEYFSLQLLNTVEGFSSGPPRPGLENVHLDVQVRTWQDVLLQAVDGRLQVGADLRVAGTASAPVLSGQMTAAPGGQVYMGGRTYDVETAVLDFSRGNGLEPWVQVRARTLVSQYAVVADVTGPATSFQTRFVSDPPLSDRDVVSLLTSGRTITAAAGGAGRTDALSMMSGGMLGKTGRLFGLDSVRIERAGERQDLDFDPTAVSSQANPASRLTFSKRWRHNLETTFSQSLTNAGSYTWFVSWKPWPPFEVRAVQRDDATGALEFRHDVSFGTGPAPATRTPARASGTGRRRRGPRSDEKVGTVAARLDGVSAPALLSGLALRPGSEFDHEKWLRDRDHLAEAMAKEGFFEAGIIARREPPTRPPRDQPATPVALEYEIRRGPHTRIAFQGFEGSRALRESIERAWYRSEYGRSIEDEAESQTRSFLFDSGYLQPRVRARTLLSADATAKVVTVNVELGEKTPVHRVVFEGNARVPGERLEPLVEGREKEAWLNRELLRQAVLEFYRIEGLLAAEVKVGPPRRAGEALALPVTIDEGPEIVLGEPKIEGASALPEEQVRLAAGLYGGQPYKPAEVAGARMRILDAYHRRGYNNATVRVDGLLDPESLTVTPTFSIAEGERQVVREVVIEGGPRVRERAQRSLDLRPGEPVVLAEWAEARKRLYDSGFFKSVDIEPEKLGGEAAAASVTGGGGGGPAEGDVTPAAPAVAAEGEEEVRAKVTVQQWPALRLRYGLQIVTEGELASQEGRSKLQLGGVAEVTRRTLWSLPASVGLSMQLRETYQQARAFFTLPRTFDTGVRTSIFLTGTHQKGLFEEELLPSQANGRVLELTVEERVRSGRKLEFAASYNTQWTDLDDPRSFFGIESERFTLARVIGTALLDGRNDLIDTSRGYFSSVSLEYGAKGLGSDFPIRKLLAQQFVYVPVGRIVLASAARWERAQGIGTTFFPEDRLLAGGANTVRGYREDSLRPLRVNLLGGTTSLLVLNEEMRFPIFGPVRGVLFGDGAILVSRLEGVSTTDSHWSTGLGLRYVTPVGILRFDFGIPLDQGFKPRRGLFYFSLGQVF
jgi:outer membrane protein assembly factor BamA/autotransporter translocation and assembly factor TamB